MRVKVVLATVVIVAMAAAVAAATLLAPLLGLARLFDDGRRAEGFRTLHELLPSRVVAASEGVWTFARDERPLPATYPFDGAERSLAAFLEATETTGLVVVVGDAIVHEAYADGYDAESLVTSFSVAKSVTAALVGIALERGHLASSGDALGDLAVELAAGGYAQVSVDHALAMASGVAWSEDYDDPRADVMRLPLQLFGLRRPLPALLASVGRERAPGAAMRYASADTLALGLALERSTGRPLATLLEQELWIPAGMEADAAWATDHHGHGLGYAFLSATLRDLARFGRLHLEGGRRDGVQVLPEAWVEAALTPAGGPPPVAGSFAAGFGYGRHWWVPEGDAGEALAIGIYGQFLYLHRRAGVVIVKTSTDPDHVGRERETLAAFRAIVAAVEAAVEAAVAAPSAGAATRP